MRSEGVRFSVHPLSRCKLDRANRAALVRIHGFDASEAVDIDRNLGGWVSDLGRVDREPVCLSRLEPYLRILGDRHRL